MRAEPLVFLSPGSAQLPPILGQQAFSELANHPVLSNVEFLLVSPVDRAPQLWLKSPGVAHRTLTAAILLTSWNSCFSPYL